MITRADYSIIKKKYNELGKGKVRLTQSTLILIKSISGTTTTYNFDVLESQNQGVLPEEIRLNLNDEFVVNDLGYYLKGSQTTERGQSKFKLFTAAPIELGMAYTSLLDAWAGKLQILVNNVNFIDRWDLTKHNIIKQTQFSNYATPMGATMAQLELDRDGMFPVSPMITLSGAKKNEINTILPYAIQGGGNDITLDDGAKLTFKIDQICIILRGFLAQNAAAFQK